MRKRQSILLSVVLVFVMMATLVGCGQKDEKAKFVGSWETKIDIEDMLKDKLAADASTAEFEEYIDVDGFTLTMFLDLKEDGTCEVSIDKEDFESQMVELIRNMMESMLGEVAAEADMTLEDLLAMQGLTMDALVEQSLAEANLTEGFEGLEQESNYTVKDGKLITGEEEWTCTFNGDSEFTVTKIEGAEDELMEEIVPLTFKKK